jgi:dTMP kinase
MGLHEGYQRLMPFVVLEGIDGSGKSTAAREIQRHLEAGGITCAVLREPTEKTDASREIRRILRTAAEIDAATSRHLLDLFRIDRVWDIKNQIKPALLRGAVVLLDRYYLSTAAYQAGNREQVAEIMKSYLGDTEILQPDMVIYLDLPVGIALKRLEKRGKPDAFESEPRLKLVAANYGEALALFRKAQPATPVLEMTGELSDEDFQALAERIITQARDKK